MIILMLFMLLAPGFIAVRVLWHNKTINREDYKFIVCDYIIYSFLILMAVYGFMFFTYPNRTVSFALEVRANSHILTASFVFKYSFVALVSALILPVFIPKLIKFWTSLEDNRRRKKGK